MNKANIQQSICTLSDLIGMSFNCLLGAYNNRQRQLLCATSPALEVMNVTYALCGFLP